MPEKTLIDPIEAVTVPLQSPSPVSEGAEVEPVVEKVWEFAKNIYPSQKIIFADNSEYQFPRGQTRIFTADAELAEKLIAVAQKYHIHYKV